MTEPSWLEAQIAAAQQLDPLNPRFILPDWIPFGFREAFSLARRRLLAACARDEISLDEIRSYAAAYRADLERVHSRLSISPAQSPNYMPPAALIEEARTVAHILWCIDITAEQGVHAGLEGLAGNNAAGLDDLRRGLEVKAGAKAGHEGRYGTKEEKEERWREYQTVIDEMHERNPGLSYRQLAAHTAKKLGISEKTVRRRTRNPICK
jgi:hypothetical protein